MLELRIDVTEAAGLGEPAWIAMTVQLPESETVVGPRPIVCFAKPGGGYSKEYFTTPLPGPGEGAQADWHVRRGWIFVSVDHLGVGGSSTEHDPNALDYTVLATAAQAAETELLERLAAGSLVEGFPAIEAPLILGIGQSMGGCMTIIQEGRFHCYDGVGILGYSAIHTHPPVAPGDEAIVALWRPRDTLGSTDPLIVTNGPQLAAAGRTAVDPDAWWSMAWGFHYADVDEETLRADMDRSGEHWPVWASRSMPLAVALSCLTPGAVSPEAAAIQAPVLVAMGERDVIADPKGEPRAYLSARSVDLFVCPRMGHMHNFASTRELFWRRLDTWAAWVAALRDEGI